MAQDRITPRPLHAAGMFKLPHQRRIPFNL